MYTRAYIINYKAFQNLCGAMKRTIVQESEKRNATEILHKVLAVPVWIKIMARRIIVVAKVRF